jgi:outer membrane protein TolC
LKSYRKKLFLSQALFLISFASSSFLPVIGIKKETLLELASDNLILKTLEDNKINPRELFSKNHLDTDYSPLKLESSFAEPYILDLKEVLSRSLSDNINLQISEQDSLIAKWRFWNQFSEALPDIDLNANKQNLDGTFYLNSRFKTEIDENRTQANFRVSYRIFNGGSTALMILAERLYKNSIEQKSLDKYNETLLNSVLLYNEVLEKQLTLSTRLKAFKEAKTNLDLTKKYFKAGTGTKFDVVQAEARLAVAQQQLILEESNYRSSSIKLAQHMNIALLTPLYLDSKDNSPVLKAFQIIDQDLEAEEFIKIAFENNPRIKSALEAKKAAFREGLSKIGDFLPKFDIYADFLGSGEEIDELNNVTTLGVQATYEIGEGLGLSPVSDLMGSKAKVKKAELQYKQELLEIEKDLRLAFLEFQRSKSFIEASLKELIAAQESYKLSKIRYENGIDLLSNLIEKETELSDAEIKFILSINSYNNSQVKLAYELGTISIQDILEDSEEEPIIMGKN